MQKVDSKYLVSLLEWKIQNSNSLMAIPFWSLLLKYYTQKIVFFES